MANKVTITTGKRVAGGYEVECPEHKTPTVVDYPACVRRLSCNCMANINIPLQTAKPVQVVRTGTPVYKKGKPDVIDHWQITCPHCQEPMLVYRKSGEGQHIGHNHGARWDLR